MDWNNDSCIQLIERYKEHNCLWDPNCDKYKDSIQKKDAWNSIGDIMNGQADELKKKMDSLLASYRRERQKSKLPKTGSGPNRYRSRWFAYPSFQFLVDRDNSRSTNNTTRHSNLNGSVELAATRTVDEGFETQNTTNSDDNNIRQMPSRQKKFKSPQRRQEKRKISDDLDVDDTDKIVKETVSNRNVRDESSLFGEYVAMKHRKYSDYTKSTVEHLISNILYEADLGKYNDPQSSLLQTYTLQE